MPELPEVETARRGLLRYLQGKKLNAIHIRRADLRWPVPASVKRIGGQCLLDVERRAKFLVLRFERNALLTHLGMSGSLRVCKPSDTLKPHDHLLFDFVGNQQLRYHDPRRFGCVLPLNSPRAQSLYTAPAIDALDPLFDGEYLHRATKNSSRSIKSTLMDQRTVAGLGNIYVSEALFLAGIRPLAIASTLSRKRLERLAGHCREVLTQAIKQGGTTLKDFVNPEGQAGYFSLHLWVYGRGGEPCLRCGRNLRSEVINQRATVYCTRCQR